jgi:hypothetical protein
MQDLIFIAHGCQEIDYSVFVEFNPNVEVTYHSERDKSA